MKEDIRWVSVSLESSKPTIAAQQTRKGKEARMKGGKRKEETIVITLVV